MWQSSCESCHLIFTTIIITLSSPLQVRHIVKRIRKIVVHVELCKEIEKDVFLSCRAWESPWGIKPQTFGFCALTLYHWTKETLWSCIMLGSAMLLVSCFVNRIRKMVSFELGKETERDVFFLSSNKTKKHLPLNKTLLPKETVKRTKLYSHKWDTSLAHNKDIFLVIWPKTKFVLV